MSIRPKDQEERRDRSEVYKRIRDKRLELFGPILRRFLSAAKRYREVHQKLSKRLESPVAVRDDIYEGVFAIAIKEPTGRQALWAFYASAQEWYITPSKVPSKARKALKAYQLMSVPNQYAYIAILAKRSTEGARRLAARLGTPIRTYTQAENDIKEYVRKRYTNLLASLRGKRIYGELAALLYLLQELAKEWAGSEIQAVFSDPLEAYRYVEEGLALGVGPPSGSD